MGIRFTREYKEIINELSKIIISINSFYEFFDMTLEEWNNLSEDEQKELSLTLADDIFYGIGEEKELSIFDATFKYNESKHYIEVILDNKVSSTIVLI